MYKFAVTPKKLMDALDINPEQQDYNLDDFDGYLELMVNVYSDGSYELEEFKNHEKKVIGHFYYMVDFNKTIKAVPNLCDKWRGIEMSIQKIAIKRDAESKLYHPNEADIIRDGLGDPVYRIERSYSLQYDLDNDLAKLNNYFDTLNIALSALIYNKYNGF